MNMAKTTQTFVCRSAGLLMLYALATIIGAVLLLLLLRMASTIFGSGVLFYRGVGALFCVFPLLMMILVSTLRRLSARAPLEETDAISAGIVAVSILFAAFVLGPVTVDRSISVFLLTQFEAAGRPLTDEEARAGFVSAYVTDWAQIDRRLREQWLSGNIEPTPIGWRLTPQGYAVTKMARGMSALFGGDPRFVGRKE